MKLVYVCYWNAFVQDGVARKINTQTKTWREVGHDVEVLCVSPAAEPGVEQVLEAELFLYTRSWERPWATYRLFRRAARAGADAMYLRADNFLPTPGGLLRAVPGVVELNGDNNFSREGRPLPYRAYSQLNQRIIERGARGLVAVTYSLGRIAEKTGKPVAVVPNSVDLDTRETLPAPTSARPRFVLLAGARNQAHGVDKVLGLAAQMPECDFTVVGLEHHQLPGTPPVNVTRYGLLAKDEYEPLLAEADVAIGPVALERSGLDEASALKVSEYLAYGLPVVIGYQETSFVGLPEPWYLLRLPLTEDNVATHVSEIRDFTARVKGRRVPRSEIAELVGVRAKEGQRLDFIARVTGQPLPSGVA